jgi:hypothetical protein
VRIEEVHPKEEGPTFGRRFLREPPRHAIDDFRRGALPHLARAALVSTGQQLVVRVEAPIDAEAPEERERTDERGRGPACCAERLGERRPPVRSQGEDPVVVHAVHGGRETRHHGDVRRERQRRRCAPLEGEQTSAGDPIDDRRSGGGVSDAAPAVASQGIHGDDEQVRGNRALARGAAGEAEGRESDREGLSAAKWTAERHQRGSRG